MLNPGDRFGDYTVVRILGQGGMGSVFLLENADGVEIAAKILDPATAGDHESRKRFLREAQLALGVKHPNLVETYDVGEDPETGLCYILMEYVPGGSLADRIKMGPMAINDAIRIVYQIASVLELARQKGIVHRDIKPGNIMFGVDGKAKLADLGIARGGLAGTETTTVTQTGMMIGTPAYMAPEQMLDAHHVDTRADIYSLGIVFYEMLVGKRPNADDTVVQLMAKAVKGEPLPDVRTLRPEVSASVAELVGLMCAMKVDERVQTPVEVTTAISQIVHGHEVTIVRKRPSVVARKPTKEVGDSSRRIVMAVFGLIAVVGVAAFVYFGSRGRSSAVSPAMVTKTNVVEKVVERMHVITNVVVTGDGVRQAQDPKDSAGQVSEGNGPGIRSARVGKYTWFYLLENGEAVITRGGFAGYEKEARPAIDPKPTGALDVPMEIDGHRVSVIGNRAFMNCRGLEKVVIPDGIRELRGWGTFYGCVRLKEVVLPPTLRRITGWSVFMGCAFKELDLRNCESVEGRSFAHLPNLKRFSVTSGNARLSVRDGALYDRGGRRLIRWPQDDSTVRLAPGTVEIDSAAFYGIRALSVTLPFGVRRIASLAFENCNQLVSVTLPKGLETLGWSTFGPCKMLKRVLFAGDAPTVDGGPARSLFGEVPEDLEIVVERGSVGWNGPESSDLPRTWPVGDRNARRVRYADDEETTLMPDAGVFDWLENPPRRMSNAEILVGFCPKWQKPNRYFASVLPETKVRYVQNREMEACDLKDTALVFMFSCDAPDYEMEARNVRRCLDRGLNVVFVAHTPNDVRERLLDDYGLHFSRIPDGVTLECVCPGLRNAPIRWQPMGQGRILDEHLGWHAMIAAGADRRNVILAMRPCGKGRLFFLAESRRLESGGEKVDLQWWDRVLRGCGVGVRVPLPVRESRLIDAEKLKDPDSTQRVQKTLDELFPGWKTSAQAADEHPGFVEEHHGVRNVLRTHPPRIGMPVSLSCRADVPARNPVLHLRLANHRDGREFRLRVRINGKYVRERDIRDGWTDVHVDLSAWAGKSVKIDLEHMPTGWCQEWAYWSVIEIVSNADFLQEAKRQSAEPVVRLQDHYRLEGKDQNRAVQKTLDVLFPGWKASENGHVGIVGYEEEYQGRYNLLLTHPLREGVPAILSRRMKLPAKSPRLLLSVANHVDGDFELQVRVDGKVAHRQTIAGEGWKDFAIDLSPWTGKNVKIEILNMPNNWEQEWAHWGRIEIK